MKVKEDAKECHVIIAYSALAARHHIKSAVRALVRVVISVYRYVYRLFCSLTTHLRHYVCRPVLSSLETVS